MTVTITRLSDDATAIAGSIVLPYSLTDESRNIETDLLSGDLAITVYTPRPTSGELQFLFATETAARAARDLHRVASIFSVADTTNPTADMTYALGSGGQTLEKHPAKEWTLRVSYREVIL